MHMASWCPGCPISLTFMLLQAIVAASPDSEKNWNMLGFLLFRVGVEVMDGKERTHNLWRAAGCFAIARRLVILRGEPTPYLIQRNIIEVGSLLYYDQSQPTAEEHQRPPDELENWMGTFWADGGAIVSKVIFALLTAVYPSRLGLETPWLISPESVAKLVRYLVDGTKIETELR